jgi:hypothetical protein
MSRPPQTVDTSDSLVTPRQLMTILDDDEDGEETEEEEEDEFQLEK